MCMTTTPAQVSLAAASIASSRKPPTSLITDAPAPIAARATAGFIVSTLITNRSPCPSSFASRPMIGSTRNSSSPSSTGSAPGRVLSPPTSMISAPCAIIACACANAASTFEKRPPSLNESGVTFRTPITIPRRVRSNSRVRVCQMICGWSEGSCILSASQDVKRLGTTNPSPIP